VWAFETTDRDVGRASRPPSRLGPPLWPPTLAQEEMDELFLSNAIEYSLFRHALPAMCAKAFGAVRQSGCKEPCLLMSREAGAPPELVTLSREASPLAVRESRSALDASSGDGWKSLSGGRSLRCEEHGVAWLTADHRLVVFRHGSERPKEYSIPWSEFAGPSEDLEGWSISAVSRDTLAVQLLHEESSRRLWLFDPGTSERLESITRWEECPSLASAASMGRITGHLFTTGPDASACPESSFRAPEMVSVHSRMVGSRSSRGNLSWAMEISLCEGEAVQQRLRVPQELLTHGLHSSSWPFWIEQAPSASRAGPTALDALDDLETCVSPNGRYIAAWGSSSVPDATKADTVLLLWDREASTHCVMDVQRILTRPSGISPRCVLAGAVFTEDNQLVAVAQSPRAEFVWAFVFSPDGVLVALQGPSHPPAVMILVSEGGPPTADLVRVLSVPQQPDRVLVVRPGSPECFEVQFQPARDKVCVTPWSGVSDWELAVRLSPTLRVARVACGRAIANVLSADVAATLDACRSALASCVEREFWSMLLPLRVAAQMDLTLSKPASPLSPEAVSRVQCALDCLLCALDESERFPFARFVLLETLTSVVASCVHLASIATLPSAAKPLQALIDKNSVILVTHWVRLVPLLTPDLQAAALDHSEALRSDLTDSLVQTASLLQALGLSPEHSMPREFTVHPSAIPIVELVKEAKLQVECGAWGRAVATLDRCGPVAASAAVAAALQAQDLASAVAVAVQSAAYVRAAVSSPEDALSRAFKGQARQACRTVGAVIAWSFAPLLPTSVRSFLREATAEQCVVGAPWGEAVVVEQQWLATASRDVPSWSPRLALELLSVGCTDATPINDLGLLVPALETAAPSAASFGDVIATCLSQGRSQLALGAIERAKELKLPNLAASALSSVASVLFKHSLEVFAAPSTVGRAETFAPSHELIASGAQRLGRASSREGFWLNKFLRRCEVLSANQAETTVEVRGFARPSASASFSCAGWNLCLAYSRHADESLRGEVVETLCRHHAMLPLLVERAVHKVYWEESLVPPSDFEPSEALEQVTSMITSALDVVRELAGGGKLPRALAKMTQSGPVLTAQSQEEAMLASSIHSIASSLFLLGVIPRARLWLADAVSVGGKPPTPDLEGLSVDAPYHTLSALYDTMSACVTVVSRMVESHSFAALDHVKRLVDSCASACSVSVPQMPLESLQIAVTHSAILSAFLGRSLRSEWSDVLRASIGRLFRAVLDAPVARLPSEAAIRSFFPDAASASSWPALVRLVWEQAGHAMSDCLSIEQEFVPHGLFHSKPVGETPVWEAIARRISAQITARSSWRNSVLTVLDVLHHRRPAPRTMQGRSDNPLPEKHALVATPPLSPPRRSTASVLAAVHKLLRAPASTEPSPPRSAPARDWTAAFSSPDTVVESLAVLRSLCSEEPRPTERSPLGELPRAPALPPPSGAGFVDHDASSVSSWGMSRVDEAIHLASAALEGAVSLLEASREARQDQARVTETEELAAQLEDVAEFEDEQDSSFSDVEMSQSSQSMTRYQRVLKETLDKAARDLEGFRLAASTRGATLREAASLIPSPATSPRASRRKRHHHHRHRERVLLTPPRETTMRASHPTMRASQPTMRSSHQVQPMMRSGAPMMRPAPAQDRPKHTTLELPRGIDSLALDLVQRGEKASIPRHAPIHEAVPTDLELLDLQGPAASLLDEPRRKHPSPQEAPPRPSFPPIQVIAALPGTVQVVVATARVVDGRKKVSVEVTDDPPPVDGGIRLHASIAEPCRIEFAGDTIDMQPFLTRAAIEYFSHAASGKRDSHVDTVVAQSNELLRRLHAQLATAKAGTAAARTEAAHERARARRTENAPSFAVQVEPTCSRSILTVEEEPEARDAIRVVGDVPVDDEDDFLLDTSEWNDMEDDGSEPELLPVERPLPGVSRAVLAMSTTVDDSQGASPVNGRIARVVAAVDELIAETTAMTAHEHEDSERARELQQATQAALRRARTSSALRLTQVALREPTGPEAAPPPPADWHADVDEATALLERLEALVHPSNPPSRGSSVAPPSSYATRSSAGDPGMPSATLPRVVATPDPSGMAWSRTRARVGSFPVLD
jgi:hypothetical protein